MKKLYKAINVLLIVALLFGCATPETSDGEKPLEKKVSVLGYDFGSPKRYDNIKKIFIPRFHDETREPHIQMEATNLLINEMTREQTYIVVPRKNEADGVLFVNLKKITMGSIRYIDKSKSDDDEDNDRERGVPIEYKIVVTADIEMLDAKTGDPIWKEKGIRGKYDFSVPDAFLEGKREATIQACADLAREITEAAVERW